MKTAKQFWFDQFGEYPNNDQEKLAVAMMAQYAEYVTNENMKQNENTPKLHNEPVPASRLR